MTAGAAGVGAISAPPLPPPPIEPEALDAPSLAPAPDVLQRDAPFSTTFGSRLGALSIGPQPPRMFVPRAGLTSTLGTHTRSLTNEVGIAGFVPLPVSPWRAWRLGYDLSNTVGAFNTEWSYHLPGVQNQPVIELFAGPAAPTTRFELFGSLSAGWRLDWFQNRSFKQLRNASVDPRYDYSLLDQRIGTIFLQWDWQTPGGGYRRLRISHQNDAEHTGGDGGDHFRTATVRMRYLVQEGDWQGRLGVGLEFFTGDVIRSRRTARDVYYDTHGLAFDQYSQGLLELELGMSRFIRHGPRQLSEFGFTIALGPDTEGIRNVFQNELVHRNLLHVPQVPLIDRKDRFKFDIFLYYMLHFG